MVGFILGVLLFFIELFIIMLILVQRGRGGGLAGAFGGMGGQSAFGAKSGDSFTRITLGAVCFWIVLCALTIKIMNHGSGVVAEMGGTKTTAPLAPLPGGSPPATGEIPKSPGDDESSKAPAGETTSPAATPTTAPTDAATAAPEAAAPPATEAPASGPSEPAPPASDSAPK